MINNLKLQFLIKKLNLLYFINNLFYFYIIINKLLI